jgi:glycosyltransferase involved in cell wall biosynthesis
LYKRVDCIVSVSNKLATELRDWGIEVKKVIPLPMKLPKVHINDFTKRENIVVHVGVGDRKNPWISVKAVEILREKLNLKLVITGGRLDIKRDFVEVVGKLSLKEYVELLSRAKALVLPFSYEAFPYAALEAMACGTPVVVSNAIPDEVVVSGFNGVRVNSLEPMEWAKALENVVTNEGLWLKLSRNGLDFAKRFDYLEIAREYINLIREIET